MTYEEILAHLESLKGTPVDQMATGALSTAADPWAGIRTLTPGALTLKQATARFGNEGASGAIARQRVGSLTLPTSALKEAGFESKYNKLTKNPDGTYTAVLQNPGQHKYDTLEAKYAYDPKTNQLTLVSEPQPTRQVSSTEKFRDGVEWLAPRVAALAGAGYGLASMAGAGAGAAGGAGVNLGAAGGATAADFGMMVGADGLATYGGIGAAEAAGAAAGAGAVGAGAAGAAGTGGVNLGAAGGATAADFGMIPAAGGGATYGGIGAAEAAGVGAGAAGAGAAAPGAAGIKTLGTLPALSEPLAPLGPTGGLMSTAPPFLEAMPALGATAAGKVLPALGAANGLLSGIDPTLLQLGGAALGAASSQDQEQTTTQKNEPWGPAQDWIKSNIASGQALQQKYTDQPFSSGQKTAYGNLYGLLNSFNTEMLPGLLGNANAMSQGYDRYAPKETRSRPNFGAVGSTWAPGLLKFGG